VKLGILGGTFDPPHIGHLIAAQDARLALGLDRVLFVPARIPPHKRGRAVTDAHIRLAMLEAAVRANPAFVVDESELLREGPSYTVDSLRHWRSMKPDAELFLLIGMDQYAEFRTWREPETIESLATVVVLARSGEQPPAGGAQIVEMTRIDISSTSIRERVRNGLPIRYLVPETVERLIERHGLYRTASE
jgi:nicotinate-nucleotide adenylyltransferase